MSVSFIGLGLSLALLATYLTPRKRPSTMADTAQNKDGEASGSWYPTPTDILVARAMLSAATKLPPDVVDVVFDYAEYWAHSYNEIDFRQEHQHSKTIHGSGPSQDSFLLRSFPVGLTGIYELKALAEELAYDSNECKPIPLQSEHDVSFFHKLANYPTPRLVNPVRKVVFKFRCSDQGWASGAKHGSFTDSWTWFEAGLERFDAEQECDKDCTYDVRHRSVHSLASPLPVCALRPLHPAIGPCTGTDGKGRSKEGTEYKTCPDRADNCTIQRNRTASKKMQDYEVAWTCFDDVDPNSPEAERLEVEEGRGRGTADGSFVRNLKMGDVVTVWGKARFPGWSNKVDKVAVEVYWAV